MLSKPGQQRGFSLLELILVLVIIGIILAAVTVSITDRRVDQLKVEAQRLAALITLATDEAVMTNQELGLLISDEEYSFVVYVDDTWQPIDIEVSRQFRTRSLPEGVTVYLQVSGLYDQDTSGSLLNPKTDEQGNRDEDPKLRPKMMMLSSAEVTPFVMRLGIDEPNPAYFEMKTQLDGTVAVEGPIYEPAIIGWRGEWIN